MSSIDKRGIWFNSGIHKLQVFCLERAQTQFLHENLVVVFPDSRRRPSDLQTLAVGHREPSGIFQRPVQPGAGNALPKAARRKLRVLRYVFYGGNRIAEHLTTDRALQKLLFGE